MEHRAVTAPIQSPCINICVMNAQTGWCDGCWRSIDEIASWGSMPDAGRLAVLADLPRRAAETTFAVPQPIANAQELP